MGLTGLLASAVCRKPDHSGGALGTRQHKRAAKAEEKKEDRRDEEDPPGISPLDVLAAAAVDRKMPVSPAPVRGRAADAAEAHANPSTTATEFGG